MLGTCWTARGEGARVHELISACREAGLRITVKAGMDGDARTNIVLLTGQALTPYDGVRIQAAIDDLGR